ncbi:MAG: hypothetical protein ACJ73E_18685 [Mycobacteriales bacterium]
MTALLLAAAEDRAASPIGLVVILCLGLAVVLLIRSMNRHLRKVSTSFPVQRPPAAPDRADDEPRDDDTP